MYTEIYKSGWQKTFLMSKERMTGATHQDSGIMTVLTINCTPQDNIYDRVTIASNVIFSDKIKDPMYFNTGIYDILNELYFILYKLIDYAFTKTKNRRQIKIHTPIYYQIMQMSWKNTSLNNRISEKY